MITAAELQVILGADTSQAERALKQVSSQIQSFGKNAASTGKMLSLGLTVPLALTAKSMIQAGMRAEQTSMAFTTLLGSSQKAGEYLRELSDFASHTPFDLAGLEDASRMMLAYGFSAERIIPILADVGDAVAGLGLGTEGIDRVIRSLGQMQQKGKVTAEEMMQLSEVGIAGWSYLAESMGLTTQEVMKLSEKGLIPAQQAIEAILSGMRKDFGGMMEKQSQTAGGAISNLKDELDRLVRSLSSLLIPTLTSLVKKITEVATSFESTPVEVQKLVLGIGGIAIAAGPALIAIGNLITAAEKLRGALMLFKGLALGELLLGGGSIAVIALSLATITNQVYRFSSQVSTGLASVQEAWKDTIDRIREGSSSANDALDAFGQRQEAVNEKAGLLGQGLLWLEEKLGGAKLRSSELSQTLLETSVSYKDYMSAMERAGLSAQAYNEQQWEVFKNLERQSAMTRFLKDDYIDLASGIDLTTSSTQTLTEYADELVNQYQGVMDSIKQIGQDMNAWVQQTASMVASGLDEWFRSVSGSASSLQQEIERLNEQIAEQKARLADTSDVENRKRLQERIAELQAELTQKTQELNRSQDQLKESTVRYEAALAMVDQIMGTNYYSTYLLEQGVQQLVDQYTRTGDLDAFKAGLQKIKDDGLAPMKSALQDAVTQAQQLYNKLMQLPKEIRVAIKVDVPPSIQLPTPTLPSTPTLPVPPTVSPGGLIPKQSGGPVQPGRVYLVGEKGPELFVPRAPGTIIPNGAEESLVININANVSQDIDLHMLADEVVYRIKHYRELSRVAL
jgi:tape measure domain-containing protein